MKKFTCILLSLLIFATPILAQNPCEDSTYLELKKKKLDEMSDREYEYFTQKEKECAELSDNKSSYSKTEESRDFNFKSSFGGIYVNEQAWAINGYSRLSNSWGYGLIYVYKVSDGNNPGGNYMPYISYEFPTGSKFLSPSIIVGMNYSYFNWSNYFYGYGTATGNVNNTSLFFGIGLNLNITDHLGIGLIGAMVESFSFTMYADGTSEIYGEKYEFLPAFTSSETGACVYCQSLSMLKSSSK